MSVKKYLSKIEDFKGRTVILTGATSGIGNALLYHLVSKHAKVVLLVRNLYKANEEIEKLKETYPEADISTHYYDQSSFASIEETVNYILKEYSDFHSLVLNAGVLIGKKGGTTVDGYPYSMGVNYYGVKHFVETLLPHLKGEHKIVIQGSIVAVKSVRKSLNINNPKNGVFTQYNTSKTYLEANFYYWNTTTPENIKFVLTEPGISSTRITRHFNGLIRFLGKYFLILFFHSSKKASLTLLTGVSDLSKKGDYIVPRGLFTMSGYPKIKSFPKRRERQYLINEHDK